MERVFHVVKEIPPTTIFVLRSSFISDIKLQMHQFVPVIICCFLLVKVHSDLLNLRKTSGDTWCTASEVS